MGSTSTDEWKRHWPTVMSSFVGFMFLTVMTATLSMFMEPIGNEFGWSRTLISFGYTCATVITALLSPFFGILLDRYGSRRVALPGILLTAASMSLFAFLNGSTAQWIALWVFYALMALAVKTTVWTAAVAGLFNSGRGLALGIALSGTAAANVILPPVTNYLIADYGWRLAYAAQAVGWGVFALVICWFFLSDAHRVAADERRQPAADGSKVSGRPDFPGLTLQQAWRSPALWSVGIATLITMTLTIGLQIHQIPILGTVGVSRTNAAWLASLAGLAAIAGKLITGVLLDRFRVNWVGGLTLAAAALAFGLLIDGVTSTGLIVFAMLVNGYTQGTKLQICSYLTVRYAGMRNYGKIFGLMTSVIALGSGVGPLIAGYAYDVSGNYTAFLVVGTIGSIVSGLLIFSLQKYPDWDVAAPTKVPG